MNKDKKPMYSKPVIVLAVIGAVVMMGVQCFGMFSFAKNAYDAYGSSATVFDDYESLDDFKDDFDDPDYSDDADDYLDESTDTSEGVDGSIESMEDYPAYTSEDSKITVKTETYSYDETREDGTYIHFDVDYPVLSGLDPAQADAINAELKKCAMISVNTNYLEADNGEQIKEYYDLDVLYLTSEVEYTVTYLTNDYISVIYTDDYCDGSIYLECYDMRARNINLKDGTSYFLEEIVNADKTLAEDYVGKLTDKYKDSQDEIIQGITADQYLEAMQGEFPEDRYSMNFFKTADGIELFTNFHYSSEDQTMIQRGWMSAPYTEDELKAYASDSTYWDICK